MCGNGRIDFSGDLGLIQGVEREEMDGSFVDGRYVADGQSEWWRE